MNIDLNALSDLMSNLSGFGGGFADLTGNFSNMGEELSSLSSATTDEVIEKFSDLFRSGIGELGGIKVEHQPEFNQVEYFKSNTLEDWHDLSENDIVTVSMKNKDDDGYTAKFVRLGDIVKFIGSKIKK